jgi:hypothetical protein
MEPVNRRSFLIKGSAGAAAVAVVGGSGFAISSLAGGDDVDIPADAEQAGPVLVQITDASSGEVEVLVGEREVRFTDRALVARVLRAAS